MGKLGGTITSAPVAEVAPGEDDDASDWDGPGDWAPKSWRKGAYTWEQADELDYEDLVEGEPLPPSWHGKRSNPTSGFSTLHIYEFNNMVSGYYRRLHAVYGVPVGWATLDADEGTFRARIDEIKAVDESGGDLDEVLSKFGFLNEEHYEWTADAVAPGYRELGDMQAKLNQVAAEQKQIMADRMAGELKGELEPVEGVSLEDWAGGQASLSQGGTVDNILAVLSIDQPAWDRISAEWNARMSRDTTATIATAYGNAFTGAGLGRFGAQGQASSDSLLDRQQDGRRRTGAVFDGALD